MRNIVGLDIGTTSIGWSLVAEAEHDQEVSKIIKLGARIIPLTADEKLNFNAGKPYSINAERTKMRSARRTLQRFKLRRKYLINLLQKEQWIQNDTPLTEIGKNTTHQTLNLRAKAANSAITLEEFARVLLQINKKRGYKSNRKTQLDVDGTSIDGIRIAKKLYEEALTPGEFSLQLLEKGKKQLPDFYASDLQEEFNRIWAVQQKAYPTIFTDELYSKLYKQNKRNTESLLKIEKQLTSVEIKGKAADKRKQEYLWRVQAIKEPITPEEVAYILIRINTAIQQTSGYLGAISDRSKELYINKITVGAYLFSQLKKDKHTSLKNQVFYRQDYLDEFECLWETQAKFHPQLTTSLKNEIRDVVIFYQRKLKSQKHLVSNCEYEKFHKAIPKSSPLFQEFKVWQQINAVQIQDQDTGNIFSLNDEQRALLFEKLSYKEKLSATEVLKTLGYSSRKYKLNYTEGLEGNSTQARFFDAYHKILEQEGYGLDWKKKAVTTKKDEIRQVFKTLTINTAILDFEALPKDTTIDQQKSYQLWHLLYAAEDDNMISEADKNTYGDTNVGLKKVLHRTYGFAPVYATFLINIALVKDYGSLSPKAIRKMLPFLREGHLYSEAKALAGYKDQMVFTKEENMQRQLASHLTLIPKNSLRNPTVEKILNQMVNLVNQIIDTYGKPDEIRIELARELKQSLKERDRVTKQINASKKINDALVKELHAAPFHIKNPSRNDRIRLKLYKELATNGYRSLYANKYIPKEKLFSKDIEIEHILPKAKIFDDSFSNKTLAYRSYNLEKADQTALDYITNIHASSLVTYKENVTALYKANAISTAKYKKLLMSEVDLPNDFIERDLRNTQYITKSARTKLLEAIRHVHTTTGKITQKLREDWGIINVLKEINLPKYRALGLTYVETRRTGKKIEQIKDWTKRNDHRHHAIDALTVAFTKPAHVQYLNTLQERKNKNSAIYGIEQNETFVDHDGKRKFKPPMAFFRKETKKHIESILISFKAKNKVTTKNTNIIKVKEGSLTKVQLTPRGRLHKDTVYGSYNKLVLKDKKIGSAFDREMILKVHNKKYRNVLLSRLETHNNDPKKAFTGKNSLSKNPIYIDTAQKEQLPEKITVGTYQTQYTIRKPITSDNFKTEKDIQKVVDLKVKELLLKRLQTSNGNAKKAFSDLDKNPIWLNKAAGIKIKRTTITGVENAQAIHSKKDHLGVPILIDGKEQAVDYVSTGNNHHIAIYKDKKGALQEQVVSLFETVTRVAQDLTIIDTNHKKEEGWEFQFSMAKNEMFVFPNDDFDVETIDFTEEKNYALISKYLYRVQKFTTKDYVFKHHLETTTETTKELKDITYKRLGLKGLEGIVKVRLNHLGCIVAVNQQIIKSKKDDKENSIYKQSRILKTQA